MQKSDTIKEDWAALEKWKSRGSTETKPDMSLIADITNAAGQLNMIPDDLIWEIHSYANRNKMVHSNFKYLINQCDWYWLPERTLKDINMLQYAFPGRAQEQTSMKNSIY